VPSDRPDVAVVLAVAAVGAAAAFVFAQTSGGGCARSGARRRAEQLRGMAAGVRVASTSSGPPRCKSRARVRTRRRGM
jgi:hypothetical protein